MPQLNFETDWTGGVTVARDNVVLGVIEYGEFDPLPVTMSAAELRQIADHVEKVST